MECVWRTYNTSKNCEMYNSKYSFQYISKFIFSSDPFILMMYCMYVCMYVWYSNTQLLSSFITYSQWLYVHMMSHGMHECLNNCY